MIFTELSPFKKFLKSDEVPVEVISDLKNELSANAQKGDTIVGTGGVRKVRIPLKGKGKSGGARVIYLYIHIEQEIFLITGYSKNVQVDLTPEQKKKIKELVTAIKNSIKGKKS